MDLLNYKDTIKGRSKLGIEAFARFVHILEKKKRNFFLVYYFIFFELSIFFLNMCLSIFRALLVIPKTLASNSGFDVQDSIIKLLDDRSSSGVPIGLDLMTGESMLPEEEGIWDNYCVKRQSFHLCTVLATQLLLVDEVSIFNPISLLLCCHTQV